MTGRLQLPTLRVDPDRAVGFNYGGRALSGLAGDSLATALYANGVRTFSRSLKYHRPRGLYSLDGECSNAMMEADGLANVRTETTLLREGVRLKSQNVLGSVDRDLYGILDRFSPLMPTGFYYRWFHRPYRLWPLFLRRIRKMAGMGCLDQKLAFDPPTELYVNADVCVVGGGAAGMSAALAAAETGLRVVLFEARPDLGGSHNWRARDFVPRQALFLRATQLSDAVNASENIRVFTSAAVTGLWGDNQVTAVQTGGPDDDRSERYIEVRAGSVVVACGCRERPLVFENNDRPGVMQPSCAWRLARIYGLLPGDRLVFCVGGRPGPGSGR